MTELQEARLLGRAIRGRWNIPESVKSDTIATLHHIAENGTEESARIAACRAIIAAEAQNQRDEHSEANELKLRIIQIAHQLGVNLAAPGAGPGDASEDRPAIAGERRTEDGA